jgi:hypothetical protein
MNCFLNPKNKILTINKKAMKRSIIFKSLSVAMVALGVWGCSSKQIAQKSGNEVYDDLYAQSGETAYVANSSNSNQDGSLNQNPDYSGNRSKKRAYSNSNTNTNDYYVDEQLVDSNSLDSRDYQRGASQLPGYNQGYNDAYNNSQYNWGNSWNNGFNNFNRFGYGSSFGNWYSPGISIMLGNRFGYGGYNPFNSFGYGGYSPYGFGGYGYNSFGYGGYYDPFYSNFYNPYSFYGGGYYGGGFISSPRYYSNNNYNNSNVIGADRTARNYGPRNGTRSSGGYNDQFVNTTRPRPNVDPSARKSGGTFSNDPSNANTAGYGSGAGGTYAARQRGGYTGNTSPNVTTNPSANNSRGATDNTYYARPRTSANDYNGSNGYSRNANGTSIDNSSRNNSSTPSYSRGSSDRTSTSSSWGNSGSSNSTYSSGSSSSSYGGNSSSGSSSGGGGGHSSGGGSRGPR